MLIIWFRMFLSQGFGRAMEFHHMVLKIGLVGSDEGAGRGAVRGWAGSLWREWIPGRKKGS